MKDQVSAVVQANKRNAAATLLALPILVLALQQGCAGGQETPPASPGATLLPPSMLEKAVAATSSEIEGSQFIEAWPLQLAEIEGGHSALFLPESVGKSGLDGMAFATYAVAIPDNFDYFILGLDWEQTGPQFSDLWLGLANFSADKWDWFPATASGRFPVDGTSQVDGGEVWAVVAASGDSPWQLSSLSLIAAPAPEGVAPEFTLPYFGGVGTVSLNNYRARKPVVLIFGSYT